MGQVLPELEAHKEQLLQKQPFPTVSTSCHDPKHSGKSGLGQGHCTWAGDEGHSTASAKSILLNCLPCPAMQGVC